MRQLRVSRPPAFWMIRGILQRSQSADAAQPLSGHLCQHSAINQNRQKTDNAHKSYFMTENNNIATIGKIARKARLRAHAPYSHFRVGAALESYDGKVFVGCNVENISFGLTICAERNAVFSAVASGVRKFRRIVIVADSKEPVTPCGACRQVLSEFSENMEIISMNLNGKIFRAGLAELLPRSKAGILDHPCST